jgi:hypothetical protein
MSDLANLHRYSAQEIIEFERSKAAPWLEEGTGMYFYAASHVDGTIYQQEKKIRELESKLKRITHAHDKLFLQLKKIRTSIERAGQ